MSVEPKPLHEVGIGDERPGIHNGIGPACRYRRLSRYLVEPADRQQRAGVHRTEKVDGVERRGGPSPVTAVVADVKVGEAQRVQTPGEVGVRLSGVVIENVIDGEARSDLDADPIRTRTLHRASITSRVNRVRLSSEPP